MSTAAASASPSPASVPKCVYCNGVGRWSKDILVGRPPESVQCPHCHGSGISGSADSGGHGNAAE